jgi:hypothetical protein
MIRIDPENGGNRSQRSEIRPIQDEGFKRQNEETQSVKTEH